MENTFAIIVTKGSDSDKIHAERSNALQASNKDSTSIGLLNFPPEIMLHILSYLDLPDLALLAQLSPLLIPLTSDPVLHLQRLRVVSPSRVNHNLFGTSPAGHALRPTVADLVRRGVMKGLGIERRWRMGAYFYSLSSIIQYENGRALSRRHASHVLSVQLRRRVQTPLSSTHPTHLQMLYMTHILPDVESSSPSVARSLLPVMRRLKWCLQRDKLAKVVKSSGIFIGVGKWLEQEEVVGTAVEGEDGTGMGKELNGIRRRVLVEGEKVRLAVCPDMKKRLVFYEMLGGKKA